jgi:hypothetical protein
MMVPENIQQFNTIVARVFEMLYEEFPDPHNICSDHFDLTAKVEGALIWREEAYQTVLSTIRWLSEEKYIRVQSYSNGLCLGVTLTQKGLSVLNATPDSLHPSETVGAKIKNALADGSKGLVSKVVEQALDIGIAYAKTKVGL